MSMFILGTAAAGGVGKIGGALSSLGLAPQAIFVVLTLMLIFQFVKYVLDRRQTSSMNGNSTSGLLQKILIVNEASKTALVDMNDNVTRRFDKHETGAKDLVQEAMKMVRDEIRTTNAKYDKAMDDIFASQKAVLEMVQDLHQWHNVQDPKSPGSKIWYTDNEPLVKAVDSMISSVNSMNKLFADLPNALAKTMTQHVCPLSRVSVSQLERLMMASKASRNGLTNEN